MHQQVDRLNKAADLLEKWADGDWMSSMVAPRHRATAELLRQVVFLEEEESENAADVFYAAMFLADTVLGDPDD